MLSPIRLMENAWLPAARIRPPVSGIPRRGTVLLTLKGHGGAVRSVVFSPDGSLVLTSSSDKTARIWNAQTGEQVKVFQGHDEALLCAAYSADGRRIVTASEDTTARIWDVATGKEAEFRLQGHTSRVTWVAFSPGWASDCDG